MNIRRIGLGLLVSAVCLYFVVRGVQWSEVVRHLSEIDLPLFLLSMLLMLAAYFLMTWRWRFLLDPLDAPSLPAPDNARGSRYTLPDLYGKMMTGYFFNAFFPARAGDLVRAYLLGRKTGMRKTTVLATIVIEKAFDGIALLLMLLLSLMLLPTVTTEDSAAISPDLLAWVAGIGLVAALGGLALFYRFSDRLARVVERFFAITPFPGWMERLAVRLIETFAGGLHVFKSPRPLALAGGISLLVWVVVAGMFLVALQSFRTPFPPELVSPAGLLFMTALVNLGLLVPALPGNVGTYEALVVAAMAVFRADKELAVAFALIFHVGQLVVTLMVGVIAFWAQNMSLADIRPVEERAESEAERSIEELEGEPGVPAFGPEVER
ncbi:MAG TPA: lysylphosphatidylglycerol synthase transmembrane domain-containing protein [Chloroflexia bacterium]|nr:lysylphosphatidylglycerol synthase transmembrane domain-containing protein [Chloroflexia bacterium]